MKKMFKELRMLEILSIISENMKIKKKRLGQKSLAVMLALVITLPEMLVGGLTVKAAEGDNITDNHLANITVVSENKMENEKFSVEKESDNGLWEEENSTDEENVVEKVAESEAELANEDNLAEETTVEELNYSELNEGDTTGLFEPVHHCTEDYTDWDYVYFGSYPQSSVSDNTITTQIDQKLEDMGLEEGDVEVGGVKYRVFKDYDSDEGGYKNKYFVWEKIKWRVLSTDDNKLFLMADCGLDVQTFGAETWIDSSIRSWLNESFYQEAFTESEQSAIQTTHLVNSESSSSDDTDDKLFLLSASEVTNEKYGFCKEGGEFLTESTFPVRALKVTEYADYVDKRDGSWVVRKNRNTSWMLRSNGRWEGELNDVDSTGQVGDQFFPYGTSGTDAVVPALYMDIDSASWIMEYGSDGMNNQPSNPIHHCSEVEDCGEYSYVYFGRYPQSMVTDEATITALDKIRGNDVLDWDYIYNGYKYNYEPGTKSYYLYEKIRWKVLAIDEDKILLQSDQILYYDCYGYYFSSRDDAPWEESRLRTQLNGNFLKKSFSEEEQNAIMETVIDNQSDATTTDKVFILSVNDVLNEEYGFCSNPYNPSGSRTIKYTNYGGSKTYESAKRDDAQGKWWLRTPGYYDAQQADGKGTCVDQTGAFLYASNELSVSNVIGIVPAIYVDIDSTLWSLEKTEYKVEDTENSYYGDYQTNGSNTNVNKDNANTNNNTDTSQNNTAIGNNQTGVGQNSSSSGTNDVKVTSLSIAAPSQKLAVGKKVKLSVKVTPSNATNSTVTWQTSNTKYATIDQNGKLTLKKAGIGKSVTVTATATDGSGVKATYKIKIMKHAVKSIKLSAASKSVTAGKSIKLKATIKTTGKIVNKTLKWTSSNTKYATVTKSGKVKTKKAGKGKTVKITAQATDGTDKKASIKIQIK